MNTYFRVARIFSVSELPWPASWLLSRLEQTNRMPSSISNSKARLHAGATTRSICLLLIGVALMGAMAEGLARFALGRMSRMEHRIDQEYRGSLTIPARTTSGQPTRVLLGNSILLKGVDFASFRSMMSSKYDVYRLVIEQTEYLDLYYILRTLFRRGSRPHDVVLCLGVGHLVGDNMRGEFTARYQDATDLVDLARRERSRARRFCGEAIFCPAQDAPHRLPAERQMLHLHQLLPQMAVVEAGVLAAHQLQNPLLHALSQPPRFLLASIAMPHPIHLLWLATPLEPLNLPIA